ncbi:MAG: hypothetical protein WC540_01135, partial [Sulfuritalea sp.]
PAAISSEAACLLNCFMFVAPIPVETSVGTASDASLLPDRRCDTSPLRQYAAYLTPEQAARA